MSTLSAIGDSGNPVDWFFLYKIPSKSTESDGKTPTGTQYVYFDPETGQKILTFSP
jgi:deoxyribonuclease-2